MKSSELGSGLFFRKVCLVGVPYCSGNTCLMIHLFELWSYVFHAICRIWDQTCWKQSWYIHCNPRRSQAFPWLFIHADEHDDLYICFTWVHMGIFGIWSVRLIQTLQKQTSFRLNNPKWSWDYELVCRFLDLLGWGIIVSMIFYRFISVRSCPDVPRVFIHQRTSKTLGRIWMVLAGRFSGYRAGYRGP